MGVRGRGRHLLFVGQCNDAEWDALESTFDDADVDRIGSIDRAIERLSVPTVDCLLVRHEPEQSDAVELGRRLLRNHSAVPCVLVGDVSEEMAERFRQTHERRRVVDADQEAVEAAVDALISERYGALPDSETPPVKDPVKNVDSDAVDELVAGDVDRDTARELIYKRQLFDTIFEELPGNLFVKDEQARHLHVSNPEGDGTETDHLGLTDPELDPEPFETHALRAFEDDHYVMDTGEAIIRKEEYIPPIDKWNRTSKIPWRNPDGDVLGLIGIAHNVTEQKRTERIIRRQNERLEQFASVVSHDLRGPLTVAGGNLELAREECEAGDEQLAAVAEAHDRIDALIDNILSFARGGSGVVEPEVVSLSDVTIDAWETLSTDEATITVADDGSVLADPSQVSRLFENLFRNALEHASEAATVRVGTLADGNGFFVEDEGPGVPPEDRESAFEMGFTTERSNTGFGLAIVEQIAEGHGWDVRLMDGSEGGARFEFTGVSSGGGDES